MLEIWKINVPFHNWVEWGLCFQFSNYLIWIGIYRKTWNLRPFYQANVFVQIGCKLVLRTSESLLHLDYCTSMGMWLREILSYNIPVRLLFYFILKKMHFIELKLQHRWIFLYISRFEEWLSSETHAQQVSLLVEGSSCNDDRSGAVACMLLAYKQFPQEDCLFIAG